jgi:hypothetical protein
MTGFEPLATNVFLAGLNEHLKLRLTLYKQPAWNRFLQVLQGELGSVRSETLMILGTSK